MYQILILLGLIPATDNNKHDEYSPNSYYEIENIGGGKFKKKSDITEEFKGNFIKITSLYLDYILSKYYVIFMVKNYLKISEFIGIMRIPLNNL